MNADITMVTVICETVAMLMDWLTQHLLAGVPLLPLMMFESERTIWCTYGPSLMCPAIKGKLLHCKWKYVGL